MEKGEGTGIQFRGNKIQENGNADQSKTSAFSDKTRQKWIRLLTVLVYILSVSVSAVLLAVYYGIFWYPEPKLIITSPSDALLSQSTSSATRSIPSRGKKG